MFFRSSPERFWNLIAKRYASSPIADMEAYKRKLERIRTYLSPEDYVLDIGCGTGTQCDDVAGSVKHVTGIDISEKLLSIAEARKEDRGVEGVEFVRTTVFDDRFEPEGFDVVMAFYVLHLHEDLDGVVQRIHGILKPNGLLVAETSCLGDGNRIAGGLIRLAGLLGVIPLINLLSTRRIEATLERAGFRVVEKIRFSELNGEYTFFARKGGS